MSRKRWSTPYAGDKLAPAIRAVAKRSGVYVIRDRESEEVLYVGECHSGALAKTIARHFQRWTGPTAGARYDRDEVEVAVRPMEAKDAVRWQNRLIEELAPRDNVTGQLTWWERLAGGGPPTSRLAKALMDEDVPF